MFGVKTFIEWVLSKLFPICKNGDIHISDHDDYYLDQYETIKSIKRRPK